MTGLDATSIAEATMEVRALRAVPCERHKAYEADCPDCLTGEQAFEQGVPQKIDSPRKLVWRPRGKR